MSTVHESRVWPDGCPADYRGHGVSMSAASIHGAVLPWRCDDPPDSVQSAPLLELVRRVANFGELEALHELVCRRRLFLFGSTELLPMPMFLFAFMKRTLPRRARHHVIAVAEKAYDLTLEKFSYLDGVCLGVEVAEDGERTGTNCRFYYTAFIHIMEKACLPGAALERDACVAAGLQRFVIHHYRLSKLEAERVLNPFMHRYAWRVNEHQVITVYMPRSMSGTRKREWLEQNIPKEWLKETDARQRVQAHIDSQLGAQMAQSDFVSDDTVPVPINMPLGPDLGEAVANEKAEQIDVLKPSIRALGPERLRNLVIEIFGDLDTASYNQSALARRYGLSPAALSRFAGSRWSDSEHNNPGAGIPCLWRNLAGLVATDKRLVKAAQQAGVWSRVQDIASHAEERIVHETR